VAERKRYLYRLSVFLVIFISSHISSPRIGNFKLEPCKLALSKARNQVIDIHLK